MAQINGRLAMAYTIIIVYLSTIIAMIAVPSFEIPGPFHGIMGGATAYLFYTSDNKKIPFLDGKK